MAKSGLDLRPKPPPSSVTCTVTSSADMPSRFATRSRAAWGDWKQPQTSHLPFGDARGRGRRLHRARARGAGCSTRPRCACAAPAMAASKSPSLRTTLPGLRAASSSVGLEGRRVVAARSGRRPTSIFSALRPCIAAQVLRATTATPPSGLNCGGRRAVPRSRTTFTHARHLERLGGVEARHLAAVHRRARDDGVEHAGQPRVDAVLGLAGRDVAAVDQLQLALADVAELRRILEAHACPAPARAGWRRALASAP